MINKCMRAKTFQPVIILLFILAGGVSCTRVSQRQETFLNIELVGPLFPPSVGPGQVVVRVSDPDGNLVDDARVTIRGDMTHAGMVPVLATADFEGSGTYRAITEWTMAGDWTLSVATTLADGRVSQQTFDLSVTTQEPECIDETK